MINSCWTQGGRGSSSYNPTVGGQRQKDHEVETSLNYTVSSRPGIHSETLSQKTAVTQLNTDMELLSLQHSQDIIP